MAELKVGDIEIRGTSVRIGGSLTPPEAGRVRPTGVAAGPPAATSLPPRLALEASLRKIPGSPTLLGVGAGVMAAVGAIGIGTGGLASPVLFVLHGAFLLPAGLALAVVGAGKRWARRTDAFDTAIAGEQAEARFDVLSRLIARTDPAHTVAGIASRLGWSEAEVVEALAWLRERGVVLEDFDPIRREFFYTASPQPRDLDARIRHLTPGA